MTAVQVAQTSYGMPPHDGFSVTHFITVADIDRAADFYEKVFGGRILSRGGMFARTGWPRRVQENCARLDRVCKAMRPPAPRCHAAR